MEEGEFTVDMQEYLQITVEFFIQWSFKVGSVQWIFRVSLTVALLPCMMNGGSKLSPIVGKYR